jgi:hypothetical protein
MHSHKHIHGYSVWLLILIINSLLFFPHTNALAQAVVTNSSVEYQFGKEITFQAVVQSPQPIAQAFVLFGTGGEGQTSSAETLVSAHDETAYQLSYTHSLANRPLRAFAEVDYRFQVRLQNGEEFTSPQFSFIYTDNRVEWQNLEKAPFNISWYSQDDIAFGDNALQTADSGLKKIQSLLPIQTPKNIDIYIYPNATTLQEALVLSGQNWVAGHADPDLGVMLAAIPSRPEQLLLMEQIIPHEMMHILLYETLGEGYHNQPTWLVEGLASIAELYPNPDYQILLNNALERDTLLSMESLCAAFPRDASSALLAYAQSASFTRYLHQQFGASGVDRLMQGYSDGLECSRGVEIAMGSSLNQLERQWREDVLGEDRSGTAVQNLLPWLVVALVVLIAPAGLVLSRLVRKPTTMKATTKR